MDKRDEIDSLWRQAVDLGLSGLEELALLSADEMAAAWNGIGPEFLPSEIRDRITDALALFKPACFIHDLRFAQSDGRRHEFVLANAELLDNCRKCAAHAYPWWLHPWKRIRANAAAALIYKACSSSAGWRAWIDAHEAQIKH